MKPITYVPLALSVRQFKWAGKPFQHTFIGVSKRFSQGGCWYLSGVCIMSDETVLCGRTPGVRV